MKKNSLVILLLVLLLSMGCHKKTPSYVLSKSKMENVLYDYHLALAMAQFSQDSIDFKTHIYAEAALRKHGITKADMDSSLVWYSEYTRDLYEIYRNVKERMDRELQSLGTIASQADFFSSLSTEGDTANVWNGKDFYVLSSNNVNNRIIFSIDADSTYLPEDTYLWHFVTHFVFEDGARQAIVNLVVHYENDSVSVATGTVSRDGDYQLKLFAADKEIKRVDGFVYLTAPWSKNERKLLIMQPTLVRYHKEKPIEAVKDTIATVPVDSVSVKDTVKIDSLKMDTTQLGEQSSKLLK